jgi:hypothetical protein
MKQSPDFVHSLPPPPDDPALTAMKPANGVRRRSFLRRLRGIERANAGCDDRQRTPVRIEIEQRPSDRRNATVDSENSHRILFPRGKITLDEVI